MTSGASDVSGSMVDSFTSCCGFETASEASVDSDTSVAGGTEPVTAADNLLVPDISGSDDGAHTGSVTSDVSDALVVSVSFRVSGVSVTFIVSNASIRE